MEAMREQENRTRRLLGRAALEVLHGAHVAVFGVGGVGGHAAEVLVRSGVGQISLFDADTVAPSNLNRQIVALHSTLGRYKVDVMAERARDINPEIRVNACRLFYSEETADQVDVTAFDYVLDCIDTVSAKLLLIERCRAAQVPILCSMGAANKLDPMAFRVADLSRTAVDPLARVVRLGCRRRGITGVKVVYSEEPPLPPLPEEQDDGETPAAGRRAVPASNAFVPAACGLLMGREALHDLLAAHGLWRGTK
ncbi:MAG: tRNA threonylcarbamoyladenosine dehydratase [Gemmiger sp.]|uniref:tRNA threonylcarbamoyladenosine dehydratase n=1 Tax=Gemmiger sp. TaxID=2049027 RepID=UPI002E767F02|nr:tRNA threonylcarbamoyladenosine dehydratase [Gemmiger sp.]MEE0801078.1 tRNA threonylcarbamoyladenosine dehydratase [Gemmiger sp.]